MEPKRTNVTPKPGEKKQTNQDLLRTMVKLSNNSRMTQEAANMLSQKLEMPEMSRLLEWMRHAVRQNEQKQSRGQRF
jgi:hypothetical protein